MKKPWISNCILVSIERKQKMFKTHYLSHDPDKIKDYKIYSNKLNKIKQIARKKYLESQFEMDKGNIKMTWKLIGTLINKKTTTNDHLYQSS